MRSRLFACIWPSCVPTSLRLDAAVIALFGHYLACLLTELERDKGGDEGIRHAGEAADKRGGVPENGEGEAG